ncbi:MAG: glycosyltransferase family 2 protein [Chloroflexi bacterium]|nr:glycosyltransferase family 2 protein [Chloroflexota bacterium]
MAKAGLDELHRQALADFLGRRTHQFHGSEALVFIPVHNEENTIARVVAGVRASCPFDILVINDGSNDSTSRILKKLGVEVLDHPMPLGANRIIGGLEVGLALGYNYVIKIDGDGQHSPQDIPRLFRHATETGVDIVIGSRHLERFNGKVLSTAGAGMWFCSRLVSLVYGKRITDTTSGLKIWSRRACQVAIEASKKGKLKDGSTYHVEELMIAARKRLRVAEIGVVMQPREFGETKSFSPKKLVSFPLNLVVSTVRALL